jgi:hypothetical protein
MYELIHHKTPPLAEGAEFSFQDYNIMHKRYNKYENMFDKISKYVIYRLIEYEKVLLSILNNC